MPGNFDTGPFLEAALLCEKILHEVDGTKSVVRIVDRITKQQVGPTPPMEMEPFEHELFLYIRLKSGSARGPMLLQIKVVKPSGDSPQPLKSTIIFEGEDDRGPDIIMGMKMKFDMTGLYWFVISLQDTVITKVPLRIVYIPQITQMLPGDSNRPPLSKE